MDIFGAELKRLTIASILLISVLSCSRIHDEGIPLQDQPAESSTDVFSKVDSLYLAGRFDQVRDSLLTILDADSLLKNEVLFRLLGLHHGRAMEVDFVSLLDSLELEGFGPLAGWKVSALDLAGSPEMAAAYVPSDQTVLSKWLLWKVDSIPLVWDVPSGPDPRHAYVIAHTAVPGSLSPAGLRYIAEYESVFPSVRSVLLRELETAFDSSGAGMIELVDSIERTLRSEILLLRMKAAADSGSAEYWKDALHHGGEACSIAAAEILQRYPDEYTPCWEVVDSLAGNGETELALEYSGRGDGWHRIGADMAFLFESERYNDLLQLTGGISSEAPDSLRARAALFRAHALKGSGERGSVYYPAYLEFAGRYPLHSQAREAAYNAGKYYDCEQDWSSAAQAYLTSLGTIGSYGGDERAHWRGGFCLYLSGRMIEADSLWASACEKWPSGYWRDEMLFWRARLADDVGREFLRDSLLQAAADEHPWEFYGMLASRRLGLSNSAGFAVPRISLMENEICSLAVELTASGFGVPAVELLSSGSAGSEEVRAAALSIMGRHGSVLRMLRSLDIELREETDGMLPDSLLCFYFPSPYRDLALASTDSLALEADVLQGIMREESYFDRWVVSRAGARGVVQLMPGTAHDVARWYDLPYLEDDDFFDPFASVPYGALYIDRQQSSFSGEIPLFLAAYNAGPGNATRWVGMHGWNAADPEMYIEQITYRETRLYVKKVLRSAWIYERR